MFSDDTVTTFFREGHFRYPLLGGFLGRFESNRGRLMTDEGRQAIEIRPLLVHRVLPF
jgi:hypothetical protein